MLSGSAGPGGAVVGRISRLVVLAGLGVVALGLVTVAVAWACSPTAKIAVTGQTPAGDSPSTAAGPAGSTATVRGSEFADGPVEVRFNSTNGPVLAREPGPDRTPTLEIRIPNEAPGVYYVVAVGRSADGAVAGKASAPFEITAPPAKNSPTPDPVATPPATTPDPAATPPATTPPGAQPPATGTPVKVGSGSQPNGRSRGERQTTSGREPRSDGRSRQRTGDGGARRGPTSESPATQRFFDASPGATDPEASKSGTSKSEATKSRAGSLLGQGAGDTSREAPTKGPSLDTGSDYLTPLGGREPTPWMSVGIGLLGLGVVVLLGGFLLATVQRRRASAKASRWPLS